MSVILPDLLDNIHILASASRSAVGIAHEMNVEEGAVINPILCQVANQSTLIMMAGDKACDAAQVCRVLNIKGSVTTLGNEAIVALTGSDIDDLFVLELAQGMPTILDASLKRFVMLYSRAGSPKCLIETTFNELKILTGGIISYAVASPAWHPPKK
ncbi:MAG: hypothetical protein JKY27_07455 [Magnetovibrio sp.]|nr:hypothetical protein [Magnetovibrio sp.]